MTQQQQHRPPPTENANLVETPVIRENIDNPTTRESLTEQCLNLIKNTKNRNDVTKEHTKQATESFALFFTIDDGFKQLEDGSLMIEETSIFPTITRVDLNTEQTAIFDRILDPMEPVWQKKFKSKIRIDKKMKRPRNADLPKASPPPKNAKADE